MDFWGWFFGSIGVIAFIMAVQPFTQMILGRPKLELHFGKDNGALQCGIQNVPIQNPLLVKLCIVRARVDDLSVIYHISKKDGNELISAITPELNYSGTISKHITLPASVDESAVFNIGTSVEVSETFFGKQKSKKLEDGHYTIYITVLYDGKQLVQTRNFIVITIDRNKMIDWIEDCHVV